MPIDPLTLSAGATVGSSLLALGAQIWGASEAESSWEKAVKQARAQERKREEQRRLELAQLRAQQTLQMSIEASKARREQQQLVLYTVAGGALLLSGLVLVATLRKPKPRMGKA